MKKLFLTVATILLVSCTQNTTTKKSEGSTVFKGQSILYEITLSSLLHQYMGDGGWAFDTNPTNNPPKIGDYTVDIYDSKKNLSCEPRIMGMYKEDLIQRKDSVVWGKVSRDATTPNGIQMSLCNYPQYGRCAL